MPYALQIFTTPNFRHIRVGGEIRALKTYKTAFARFRHVFVVFFPKYNGKTKQMKRQSRKKN